jgi:hypothetical protein
MEHALAYSICIAVETDLASGWTNSSNAPIGIKRSLLWPTRSPGSRGPYLSIRIGRTEEQLLQVLFSIAVFTPIPTFARSIEQMTEQRIDAP